VRPSPQDYGQVPEEGEAAHKYYAKALEALANVSNFQEHLKGRNNESIKAAIIALNYMLADDYEELIPEGARTSLLSPDQDAYEDYKRALATLEQYIQENKAAH
jgi:antitoxin component HigA of HigAB toxin-antitoxin module